MAHNDAYLAVIAALRQHQGRIGGLLDALEDGRWWPDDPAGIEDALVALAQLEQIGQSLSEVEGIVALLAE